MNISDKDSVERLYGQLLRAESNTTEIMGCLTRAESNAHYMQDKAFGSFLKKEIDVLDRKMFDFRKRLFQLSNDLKEGMYND